MNSYDSSHMNSTYGLYTPFKVLINYRQTSVINTTNTRIKKIKKSAKGQQPVLLKRSDIPLQNDPLDLARLKKKRRVQKHLKHPTRLQDTLQRKQRELFNKYLQEQFRWAKAMPCRLHEKQGRLSFEQLLSEDKPPEDQPETFSHEDIFKKNLRHVLDTRILKTLLADRRIFDPQVQIPQVVQDSLQEYTRLQRMKCQDVFRVVYPDEQHIDAYIDLEKEDQLLSEDEYSCMVSQFQTSADITPKSLFSR